MDPILNPDESSPYPPNLLFYIYFNIIFLPAPPTSSFLIPFGFMYSPQYPFPNAVKVSSSLSVRGFNL
jgi:hypothetical protein